MEATSIMVKPTSDVKLYVFKTVIGVQQAARRRECAKTVNHRKDRVISRRWSLPESPAMP